MCVYIYILLIYAMDNMAYLVAQMVKNLPVMQETWVRSLGWKDPLRREQLPTPVFWPGEFHGQRSLAGYSPRIFKETHPSDFYFHLWVN